MFSKQHESVLADLSTDLRDEEDWKVGSLKAFDFPLNVTTLAIEPISGLLAAGTADGVIHIFGRPGVYSKINCLNRLKFDSSNSLFRRSTSFASSLGVWRPKYVTSARFDQTNSMTLSPSHTHVFLATQNGDIKTYDLTCLRKSPYSMPNLWKLYEQKMASSGMPSLTLPTPSNAVEAVVHPRNLDLIFVAYAGGVILTDLNTIRAYELVLSPGAPGGAGYGTGDILTHRRMMVASIAVHPSGHFFAAGYADGSIAFWAVEDDNKPLLVRTLDSLDVNLVHADLLETHSQVLQNP
ncbi:WD40-repeat-containing domain protein [Flammula alnicola]|nr:WD40-repeat-containing domain protein [Flammula alnicola]